MSIQWTAINAGKVAIFIVSFFKDQTLENIKQVDFCLQNLETVIRTCKVIYVELVFAWSATMEAVLATEPTFTLPRFFYDCC